jgi:ParB family chromosome partitioning protein
MISKKENFMTAPEMQKSNPEKGDSQKKAKAKKAPKKKAAGLGRGLNALLGEVRTERPITQDSAAQNIGSESGSHNSRAIALAPDSDPLSVAASSAALSDDIAGQNINQASITVARDSLVEVLPIARIKPHPGQPRRFFDNDALDELAASIKQRGVIQPVIVRPAPDKPGHYQLVAGERRWRAAQRARLHEIPALVRELDERDTLTLALIENIQREDLTPIEEARAYRNLMEQDDLNHNALAQMVDKSRSHVANMIRLLALPDSVLSLVDEGKLSMGHARALINADDAQAIAQKAVKESLSVRQIEKLVRKKANPVADVNGAGTSGDAALDADIATVERHLSDLLGMNVSIEPGKNSATGQLSVRYSSLDQLDLLCQRLSGEPL